MNSSSSHGGTYLREAQRLYGLAIFNEFDSAIRGIGNEYDNLSKPTEVVYYLDAAVLLPFFVWPGRFNRFDSRSERVNLHYLPDIGGLRPVDAVVEAALSGEFLCEVPSNLRRVRMLPAHFSEFLDAAERFKGHWSEYADQFRQENRIARSDSLRSHFLNVLDVAEKELIRLQEEHSEREAADQGRRFSEIISQVEEHPIAEFAMIQRVLKGLIESEPLPFGARFPNPQHISDWQDALVLKGKTRSRAEHDARCLVQIEALNEIEREKQTREGSPPVVHCLVTGDRRIHKAYTEIFDERWTRINGSNDQVDIASGARSRYLSSFYLRHPGQFVPTLNQNDLPNQVSDISENSLFDSVVRTAKAIITRSNSEDEANKIAFGALFAVNRKEVVHGSDDDSEIEGMRQNWRQITYLSAWLNRTLIVDRHKKAKEIALEITPAERQFIVERQEELLTAIRAHHLPDAARQSIDAVARQIRKLRRTVLRTDTYLLGEYRWTAQKRTVLDIENALLRSDETVHEELDIAITYGGVEAVWQSFLLCGLLSELRNDWRNAAWYFERANDAIMLKRTTEPTDASSRCDLLFLLGRARRFRSGIVDFEDAWHENLKAAKIAETELVSTPLAAARSRSELATLYISHLMQQSAVSNHVERNARLSATGPFDPRKAPEVRKWLENACIVEGNGFDKLADYVHRQASLNLAVLMIFSTLNEDVAVAFSDIDDQKALAIVDSAVNSWPSHSERPPLVSYYLGVLEMARAKLNGETGTVPAVGTINNGMSQSDVGLHSKIDRVYAEVITKALERFPALSGEYRVST